MPNVPMQVARCAARASPPRSVRTKNQIGCDCCTVLAFYLSRAAVLLTVAVRARAGADLAAAQPFDISRVPVVLEVRRLHGRRAAPDAAPPGACGLTAVICLC